MAENVNFIAAKDLPITEAQEVDVLCIDNGELKRKAGANIGGSGGGYVIHVPIEDIKEQSNNSVMIELTESYDNFAEILYNGGSVWLDLSVLGMMGRIAVTMWGYEESEDGRALVMLAMLFMGQLTMFQIVCQNGTLTPPGME